VQHDPNFLSETPVKRLKVENEDPGVTVHEIVDCNEGGGNIYSIQDSGFASGGRRGEKNIRSGGRGGGKGSMGNCDPEDMLIDNSIRVDGTDHLTIAKLIQRIESSLMRAELEHQGIFFLGRGCLKLKIENALKEKNSDKGNGTFRDWKRNFCKQ
jgi:hypothetical protein